MKLIASRILFEPSSSKAATNNHVSLWLAVVLWQLHGPTSGTPALRSFIYWDVGEPTRHPCSTTGMMQDNHFLQLSVSLRFLGVFLCCFLFGLCLCLELVLFRLWKTPGWLFAFHLFSYNVRIADRPQDVLMTVRASSVHGMS